MRWSDCGNWRTLGLAVICQGLIVSILFLPLIGQQAYLFFALVPLITLHSSIQHEVIHRHPFQNQRLNDLLVLTPLGLLVPYYRFKDTHLAHHMDVNLCDPYDDPESWYQSEADWNKRSALSKAVFNFNNTLFGRMLIGPLIGMVGFVRCDIKQAMHGQWDITGKWALHLGLTALIVIAVAGLGTMPLPIYFAAAYFGMSLLMVRTYLEHRIHEKVRGRSVIIEKGGVFGFLFLNNNFHAVHHAHPGVAWFRLPAFFRENKDRFFRLNTGYSYSSYRQVFRRYFFQQKEPVAFPAALSKKKPH
jgi:fatty acid desaturase